MKIGLTLGKYAPLHKGHEFVIETAIQEMDKVIVMIYACPQTTSVPLSIRTNWIRELFPSVEVIEAPDGPTEVGDTDRIKKLNEDYILKRIGKRGITHFYSSEFYGEHVSKALGAVNRIVDADRKAIPVSATQIRKNTFENRHYLSQIVYRDLIQKVVFMGAPSTGKTTLAQALAQKFSTNWMPEYGREYWEKNQTNRRLTSDQLVEIAEGHLEREEALLLDCNKFLFVDTNAITTYLFAVYYHGDVHPQLAELANQIRNRYSHTFVCGDDIPYDNTWCRSGKVNRKEFQQKTLAELERREVPFTILPALHTKRIELVESKLKNEPPPTEAITGSQ